jgi:hypothetical protein
VVVKQLLLDKERTPSTTLALFQVLLLADSVVVKQLLLDKERTPSTTLAIQHMNNFSEFVKVSLLSTTLLLILDFCCEVLA